MTEPQLPTPGAKPLLSGRAALLVGLLVVVALGGLTLWRGTTAKVAPETSVRDRAGRSLDPFRALPAVQAERKERVRGAIDVLLLVIDAARPDFMSLYGDEQSTTPFLQLLAKDSISFTRAYSTSTWTAPAMYSMFTGLYPREHGITAGADQMVGGRHMIAGQQVLPDQALTLTEQLASAGYETFGVCTNHHLRPSYGFAQGFAHFLGDDFLYSPFPELAIEALAPALKQSQKYFLWVHYFDLHFPYSPREPWFSEFNSSRFKSVLELSLDFAKWGYRKRLKLSDDAPVRPEHAELLAKTAIHIASHPYIFFKLLPLLRHDPDGEYGKLFRAVYKSNVRFTDENIKKTLAALGVDDRTLIVVTADHGEELLERGALGHQMNSSLYDEVLRVPLLVRLPGGEHGNEVIDAPVSLVDVMPTILDYAGAPETKGLPGRSLRPLIERQAWKERLLFAEVRAVGDESRTVIEGQWKYTFKFKSGKRELFDTAADPGERTNLAQKRPDKVQALHDALLSWMERTPTRWQTEAGPAPTPAEILRLKQLGYVRDEDLAPDAGLLLPR